MWKWIDTADYPATVLVDENDDEVLEIYESHGGGMTPSDEHKLLLAAAPDLLEALEAIVGAIEMTDNVTDFLEMYDADDLRNAFAAIDKAKGCTQ